LSKSLISKQVSRLWSPQSDTTREAGGLMSGAASKAVALLV